MVERSDTLTHDDVERVVASLREPRFAPWSGGTFATVVTLPEAWSLLILTLLEALDDAIEARAQSPR